MEQIVLIGLISVIGIIPGPAKVKGVHHYDANPQNIIYQPETQSNTATDSFGTHTRVLRLKPVQGNNPE